MTRIGITWDEWYPVYSIEEGDIEVNEKTLKRWIKAIEKFDAVQQELAALLEKQGHEWMP